MLHGTSPMHQFRISTRHGRYLILFAFASIVFLVSSISAQETNPVDRKVANPMTDTPNVNPLTQDQPIPARPALKKPGAVPQAGDEVTVDAQKATETGKE